MRPPVSGAKVAPMKEARSRFSGLTPHTPQY
jgi:hypothetical protein